MHRLLSLLLLTAVLLSLTAHPARGQGEPDPAQSVLDGMSPAERVGQLFIVSFVGRDSGSSSAVAQLIREERVGGVVFLAANQNFANEGDAPMQVRGLAETLQGLALEGGRLPLLIAMDHEGDGWPYSRLTAGTTPLPSPMAVGATWNVERARQMGQVTGQELAAAGINLVLGPDVDVLNEPQATSKGDLGTRVFGGDPYWVGQMGRAYITGIHEGSAGRAATVAKHFPGHGGSDRLPDDEVATVDKSLLELRRMELAPFFAVTRFDAAGDLAVTDALMSSHIRYRGFQGNIRQFTAPISFDPQGLRTILAEPEFEGWRADGLIVSDSLGVPAVRRYYDPSGASFPHRQLARDALMAGNDVLILAQYALEDAYPPQLANMRDTLAFFREQYSADRTFAARVDEAVLRVIRLKLRLYPEFAEGGGPLPPLPEPSFGGGRAVTEAVAEEALTLIFPRSVEELAERLPRAPLRGEPIVVFTDGRRVRDCFDCPYYPLLPTDALQRAILRRYGPAGTGQITEAQIISLSFEDLKLFLGVSGVVEGSENPEAARQRAEQVRALVEGAEWILLVMQDINLSPVAGGTVPRYPESDAARLLLDAAPGSLFNKRVVAFFFNVPYQFDTTEISKLSAAYALYSKQEPFIEVAVRALFKEATPHTAPPVTVEATNYDLATQLEPSPDQPLTLYRVGTGPLLAPAEVTIETSVLLDRNGHPVPDGTAVDIMGEWREEPGAAAPQVSTTTVGGVARATVPLAREGALVLHVQALQAKSERPLLLTVVGPTPTPSPSPEATVPVPPTATAPALVVLGMEEETPPAALPPSQPAAPRPTPPPDPVRGSNLAVGLLGTVLAASTAWQRSRGRQLNVRLRWTLVALAGGLGIFLVWAVAARLSG